MLLYLSLVNIHSTKTLKVGQINLQNSNIFQSRSNWCGFLECTVQWFLIPTACSTEWKYTFDNAQILLGRCVEITTGEFPDVEILGKYNTRDEEIRRDDAEIWASHRYGKCAEIGMESGFETWDTYLLTCAEKNFYSNFYICFQFGLNSYRYSKEIILFHFSQILREFYTTLERMWTTRNYL